MPKKAAADAKDLSDYVWDDSLFDRLKSYKTSSKEDAAFKEVRAHWRKFHMSGELIIAVQGEKVSKKEIHLIKSAGGDLSNYMKKVVKKKTEAQIKKEVEDKLRKEAEDKEKSESVK